MDHMDSLRKLLLLEPRGYPCQNANIVLPSTLPEAAFGFVILEQNKIYPAMSGHNTICVATALLETGMVAMTEPVTEFALEAPAGLVRIRANCTRGKVTEVTFRNVPSFVQHLDKQIEVPELGKVTVDVAFGGMWYVVVDAPSLGLDLVPSNGKRLCKYGEMIKQAAKEQLPVNHPEYDYPGPDILVFRGPAKRRDADAANTVVMSNVDLDWDNPSTWTGMLDRSPCGTGTSAVMATLWARNLLPLNQDFVHESIVGTTFRGRLVEEAKVGGFSAVVPEISGQAWITQHCQVVCHPTDPFPEGYTVGDIWG